MRAVAELFPAYREFHAAALDTHDVDPVYPVYGALLDSLGVSRGSGAALWLTVCHLTWYNMASALRAWELLREGTPVDKLPRLACATERRGNRDDRQLLNNLLGWKEHMPLFLEWQPTGKPGADWRNVMDLIDDVPGNGRWAAYKMAEILQKVNGWPLKATDMGHANSSGPRRGLELLYKGLPKGDDADAVRYLDAVSEGLVAGLEAYGLKAPIEEVETTLCDFHALVEGRYYVGHDIDQMQDQLRGWDSPLVELAFDARRAALPLAYLGEHGGWTGVDSARNAMFKNNGQVILRG